MYTPSRFADFNLVFLREQKHNSIFLTKKIKSGQFGCGVWKHMDLQASAGVCQSSHAASSILHDRKLRKEQISNAAFSLSPKQYLFARSCMNTACLLRFSDSDFIWISIFWKLPRHGSSTMTTKGCRICYAIFLLHQNLAATLSTINSMQLWDSVTSALLTHCSMTFISYFQILLRRK